MKNVFIYGLMDPITEHIRYVGKATYLKKRLTRHIGDAKSGYKTHKHDWIRYLLEQKLKPKIVLIDEVPENDWQRYEKMYIKSIGKYEKSFEYDLTNATDGGEGGATFTGRKLSKEHKLKISNGNKGKTRNESVRKQISKTKTGVKMSNEFKLKQSILKMGKKHSEETKRKISEKNKGRKMTLEQISKNIKSRKGLVWINKNKETKTIHIEKINDFINNGWKRGRK